MVIEHWVLMSSMSLIAISPPMLSQKECEKHVENMKYRFVSNYCVKLEKTIPVDTINVIRY